MWLQLLFMHYGYSFDAFDVYGSSVMAGPTPWSALGTPQMFLRAFHCLRLTVVVDCGCLMIVEFEKLQTGFDRIYMSS